MSVFSIATGHSLNGIKNHNGSIIWFLSTFRNSEIQIFNNCIIIKKKRGWRSCLVGTHGNIVVFNKENFEFIYFEKIPNAEDLYTVLNK